jgi:hypothetical protein
MPVLMRLGLVFLLFLPAVFAAEIPVLVANELRSPPEWAVLERHVIEVLNEAGEAFVRTYANPDGTLRWKERYEGGMNSSDDLYEGFRGLSLHYAIGGSRKLDILHRQVWEGITRQFTRYGNVYREFDGNWDWMHHGEGYTSFYTFGLARPDDVAFRRRSEAFAAMYSGEDPLSPNYDPEKNMIRAVMNGSRGPKMEWTVRDWIPTNANLVYYHLPYNDIPGVDTPTGWINDKTFAIIVKTMSERMAKGDVPINLTLTPLVADAYLYTGDEKYKRWIKRYVQGWVDRTDKNNGITPDNVGLSGEVGEYTGGHWWGGYYGWRWPRGGLDVVRAELTAAKVALMLTGDRNWLELPRSQMAVMRKHGRIENGVYLAPARYGEEGWHHYTPEPVYPYIWLWAMSQDEGDRKNVERLSLNPSGGADLEWFEFLQGRRPGYPVTGLQADLSAIQRRLTPIRNEHGDPETWFDAHWLSRDPMQTGALERLTLGAVPIDRRGEMLHARVRYFCADQRRPGLPDDVAALVTSLRADGATAELVNLSPTEQRRVIVQGGAYGEHRIQAVNDLSVNGLFFEVRLAPGAGMMLELSMDLYSGDPSYAFPWSREEALQ